jgi:hypothetical protein
MGNLEEK